MNPDDGLRTEVIMIHIKHILCPVDLSSLHCHAFDQAVGIARRKGPGQSFAAWCLKPSGSVATPMMSSPPASRTPRFFASPRNGRAIYRARRARPERAGPSGVRLDDRAHRPASDVPGSDGTKPLTILARQAGCPRTAHRRSIRPKCAVALSRVDHGHFSKVRRRYGHDASGRVSGNR